MKLENLKGDFFANLMPLATSRTDGGVPGKGTVGQDACFLKVAEVVAGGTTGAEGRPPKV